MSWQNALRVYGREALTVTCIMHSRVNACPDTRLREITPSISSLVARSGPFAASATHTCALKDVNVQPLAQSFCPNRRHIISVGQYNEGHLISQFMLRRLQRNRQFLNY